MKLRTILSTVLTVACGMTWAQKSLDQVPYSTMSGDTVIYHYNKKWKFIDNKNNRTYYRKTYSVNSKEFAIEDYFENGQLQMKAYGPSRLASNSTFNKEATWYFEDGKVSISAYYKKGDLHGERKTYHENGQLASFATYKKGELHGEYTSYHENGQIEYKATYVKGDVTGATISYYENGQIEVEGQFKDGERDGVWKIYYENGQLLSEEEYEDGSLHGEFKDYHENGEVESEVVYNAEGSIISYKEFHDNGQLLVEMPYLSGRRDGEVVYFSETGDTAIFGSYVDNEMSGGWKKFNKEGGLISETYFDDGDKVGTWKFYNRKGDLWRQVNYEENVLEEEIFYNEKGEELSRKDWIVNPTTDIADLEEFLNEEQLIPLENAGEGKVVIHVQVDTNGVLDSISVYSTANDKVDAIFLEFFKERKYKAGTFGGKKYKMGNEYGITFSSDGFFILEEGVAYPMVDSTTLADSNGISKDYAIAVWDEDMDYGNYERYQREPGEGSLLGGLVMNWYNALRSNVDGITPETADILFSLLIYSIDFEISASGIACNYTDVGSEYYMIYQSYLFEYYLDRTKVWLPARKDGFAY